MNVGDDVSLLVPGFYHADTSELVQLLQKGHYGVNLDRDAWDRLVTWIDLNGPCHGTWRDVFDVPLPDCVDQRRRELYQLYGGPPDDPEQVVFATDYDQTPVMPAQSANAPHGTLPDRPLDGPQREEQTERSDNTVRLLDLGQGLTLSLVKVPAGRFVMGDVEGSPNERPLTAVEIGEPFWMSVGEISNRQYQQFRPTHDSGFYTKRHAQRTDDRGMALNGSRQPALKVSWDDAMQFCHWLSARTGLEVTLPTEAQWEYACRAGSDAPLHYGDLDTDFARYENMADRTFATFGATGKSLTGKFEIEPGVDYLIAEGVDRSDLRFDDGACVTAPVASRVANAFGLRNMHGNVAEWTLSLYRPYPYDPADGRNALPVRGERVVRGGSFLDRPARCRSAARYSYPGWQQVHNVGFRVVINHADGD